MMNNISRSQKHIFYFKTILTAIKIKLLDKPFFSAKIVTNNVHQYERK
jgi:hypothetical protein